jgi:cbb3-type cytochrome oxidase cytochrome c subunit
LTKARIIKEFDTIDDAKKVEETVKTGYAETSIESLVQWAAVEDDLAESYEKLAASAKDPAKHDAFLKLGEESKRNVIEINGLVTYLEGLDRARAKRIEELAGLKK